MFSLHISWSFYNFYVLPTDNFKLKRPDPDWTVMGDQRTPESFHELVAAAVSPFGPLMGGVLTMLRHLRSAVGSEHLLVLHSGAHRGRGVST